MASGSAYSALLFVSFRPSLLRSRSRFTGARSASFRFYSVLRFPFALAFRFLSSASGLELNYSALPFFLSALFPSSPHVRLLRCSVSVFRLSSVFPLPSRLVSRPLVPLPLTRLPVCFLSPFPASLPQLFHRCLPFLHLSASFSGLYSCPSVFFRPPSGLEHGYLASVSSFPFFRNRPHSGSLCAASKLPFRSALPLILLRSRLSPCVRSGFGTWLSCVSFQPVSLASQGSLDPFAFLLTASQSFRTSFLLSFRRFPFAFASGSVYSACDIP